MTAIVAAPTVPVPSMVRGAASGEGCAPLTFRTYLVISRLAAAPNLPGAGSRHRLLSTARGGGSGRGFREATVRDRTQAADGQRAGLASSPRNAAESARWKHRWPMAERPSISAVCLPRATCGFPPPAAPARRLLCAPFFLNADPGLQIQQGVTAEVRAGGSWGCSVRRPATAQAYRACRTGCRQAGRKASLRRYRTCRVSTWLIRASRLASASAMAPLRRARRDVARNASASGPQIIPSASFSSEL